MGNFFWGTARKIEHPCAYMEGFDFKGYKCICGHKTSDKSKHFDHVIKKHSQQEAYELLPANDYNKHFNTPEYQAKQKQTEHNRQRAAFLKKEGLKKIKSKLLNRLGFIWIDPDGKRYSDEEIEQMFKEGRELRNQL